MPKNSSKQSKASSAKRRWRALAKLIILALLIFAANLAADWVVTALKLELRPSNEDAVHQVLMISALVYALLIAIPFVPGVEIGLALIGMVGPGIVFLVYVSTIAGLAISFFVGRLMSLQGLINLFEGLRLANAARLLSQIEPMDSDERLRFLVSKAPSRIVPILLKHRHLALAIAINTPGNIVLGGGGGLALMAGVSRLFSIPAFLVTIAIATAPVPVAVLLFGSQILPQ